MLLKYCLHKSAQRDILFHKDNGPVHTSVVAITNINKLKLELLPCASYLLELTISDYVLISNFKQWFSDKRFDNTEEVGSAIHGYFEELIINRISKLLSTAV